MDHMDIDWEQRFPTSYGDPKEACVVHLFIPAAEVILVDHPWDFLLHRIGLMITQRGFLFWLGLR